MRSEPTTPPAVFTAATAPTPRPTWSAPAASLRRGREGRSEERRRQEQDRGRRHHEARHDFDRLPARQAHRPRARGHLRLREPAAEQEHRAHGAHRGAAEQQPEGAPGLRGPAPPCEQQASEREPGQVRRQHDGEGVRPRAQERHEQLGPGDLVTERDSAGESVEHKGETRVVRERRRGRRGHGSLGAGGQAAIERESGRRDGKAENADRYRREVMPNAGTSTKGVASVPRTAPVVLAP